MEVLFNITNLKSLITFVHLAGLAIGLGGAWVLDAFIVKHLHNPISKDKYFTIEFVSKFVLAGLVILWLSGFSFIGYYYLYTPEFLVNQKVWGKLFIVVVLTLNGFLVHRVVLPRVNDSIGRSLADSLSEAEIKKLTVIGVVSFMSWIFPVILGVSKTLNFSVPAIDIIAFYLVVVVAVAIFASILSSRVIGRSGLNNQPEG
ncbi:hypothetical protein [uncultured Endozoicomonas sp.]|uniref:hypothetical protein n=1 Tax=uncultured Endozoicomonas sp. TaxID=432652 RepID=UPI00260E1DE6|nr:hypothetical protein [uncultured Endozoicomonas sp.]